MIGYPFFYENVDLYQDEKFLRFSLDRIPENSKLSLIQAGSLPIIVEAINLELGNKFTYQFCDQISQLCGTFHVIDKTQTLVLDYNAFVTLSLNRI